MWAISPLPKWIFRCLDSKAIIPTEALVVKGGEETFYSVLYLGGENTPVFSSPSPLVSNTVTYQVSFCFFFFLSFPEYPSNLLGCSDLVTAFLTEMCVSNYKTITSCVYLLFFKCCLNVVIPLILFFYFF